METINSISTLEFISMLTKDENPLSIAIFTLTCKILIWIARLQDLYLCFRFLFQSYSQSLISTFEGCWSSFAGKRRNVDEAGVASFLKPCINEDVKNEVLIKEDIEIVMEKLGISWDSSANEFEGRLGLGEISTLFEETEPSLEEVKEAFDVFDVNKDGYIDAEDLDKTLCALGYTEFSELECQRMIIGFSNNEDKRIDLRQFVKVIELSFC
ncbi:probable calcium-binding protein CML45 [Coffea eugenioides]|uniref:probable calcium-binding protein CML45 n=1 Tax=Coffea eugenioides TaxID=49369 RepID=UPI000F604AA2|nr:probable calcium-binding protein CML45 [Coffea eugenioides]